MVARGQLRRWACRTGSGAGQGGEGGGEEASIGRGAGGEGGGEGRLLLGVGVGAVGWWGL